MCFHPLGYSQANMIGLSNSYNIAGLFFLWYHLGTLINKPLPYQKTIKIAGLDAYSIDKHFQA